MSDASTGLMTLYQDLIKDKSGSGGSKKLALSQAQALQMLFDVKFINIIMSGRMENTKVGVQFWFAVKCDPSHRNRPYPTSDFHK